VRENRPCSPQHVRNLPPSRHQANDLLPNPATSTPFDALYNYPVQALVAVRRLPPPLQQQPVTAAQREARNLREAAPSEARRGALFNEGARAKRIGWVSLVVDVGGCSHFRSFARSPVGTALKNDHHYANWNRCFHQFQPLADLQFALNHAQAVWSVGNLSDSLCEGLHLFPCQLQPLQQLRVKFC